MMNAGSENDLLLRGFCVVAWLVLVVLAWECWSCWDFSIARCGVFVFVHRPSHGRLAMASCVAMSCGFCLCNYFLELHDVSALLLTLLVFPQLWQFKSKV